MRIADILPRQEQTGSKSLCLSIPTCRHIHSFIAPSIKTNDRTIRPTSPLRYGGFLFNLTDLPKSVIVNAEYREEALMRTHRKMFVVSLIAIAVALCAVTTAPTIARAQSQARVVTRNIITGTLVRGPAMNFDKALATAISTATSRESVSCWLETKHHWFNPFRAPRIPIVHSRRIEQPAARR
jgi:hypothetical protein